MKLLSGSVIVLLAAAMVSCDKPEPQHADPALIDKYLAQYSPYEMKFDASGFDERDKTLLKKLVEVSTYLDTIYWLQTSKYGMHLRDSLMRPKNDPVAEKLLTLLVRNAGPFEQLNNNVSFMGNQPYYPGHELYPRGMTAEMFDAYVETLPEEEKKKFLSPYTVIREDGKGGYKAVWYHEEYKTYIDPIVKLLNDCAELTDNASFANFLRLKAKALSTDDYFDADVAWIDMEGSKFDIVFGPFETYADGIKGIKAKYEASVEVIDQEESKNLARYTRYLKDMEENLPIPRQYKSEVKGLTAQFVIVRDIIRTGEMAAGYQAVAANLPNDPEVHAKKGTKKTFWKNMFEARFNTIIKPVSLRLIDPSQVPYLSDDGFFQFVLMHEICHAVGPRTVKVGPKKGMATNAAIGPNYNALEEAKADIAGLHSLVYLMDKGVVDKTREKEFFVSYLGSTFRSIRFGLNQAHGRAAVVSLNYFKDKGALLYDTETKMWSIDFGRIRPAVRKLARELLILLGDGDNQKVQVFFDQWTTITPELQASLNRVSDIAVDVMPRYSIKWE